MIQRNWQPNGIIIPPDRITQRILLSAPKGWEAPFRVDSTSLCRPADNQGNIPSCAGWASANHGEVATWAETHAPVQYDGLAVYYGAKRIDGHPEEDGTDGISALQAAFALGMFPATHGGLPVKGWKVRWLNTLDDIKFAIHRWRTCTVFYKVTPGWDAKGSWIGTQTDVVGNHAVLGNWYDDRREGIGWLNQWGLQAGTDGNQRMTYDQHRATCIGGCVAEPVPFPVPVGSLEIGP